MSELHDRPVREALLTVPLGAHNGWNRYDTDNEHVLSLWTDGQTWDIRVSRKIEPTGPRFYGRAEAQPGEEGT